MPICVAGMHRSGTSLVARLLRRAGLYLGEEADILAAGVGNSEGHWENLRFIELNDAILDLAGGSWDRIPTFEGGWPCDPKFDPLLERAGALLHSFEGREPWGWKDPRNSLTLPFWLRLIPDIKVVICLRNPLEVAQSLEVRNGFPAPKGVELWAAYSARVAAAVPPERRLVTHYESYFHDFRAEAERLARFAGLPAHDPVLGSVANDNLRHNRLPLRDFLDGRIQHDFVEIYLDLCAEAGPVFQRAFPADLVKAIDPSAARAQVVGDPMTWMLGRSAVRVVEQERSLMELQRQLDRAADALRESRSETEAERRRADAEGRRAETLLEQLTWKRYQWADWAANWLRKVLPSKRK